MIFGIGEVPVKKRPAPTTRPKHRMSESDRSVGPKTPIVKPKPVVVGKQEETVAGIIDLEKMRKELAELKQKRITGSLPNGSLIAKKRKEIARTLTRIKTNAKKTT